MKNKLTVEQQIQDLKDKNVRFELFSEEDAKAFLTYNNYYFKLKAYAKNYIVHPGTKKYYNLDFAYLVELSKLDVYVRRTIMELSLDVEHYLKVALLSDMSRNSEQDGYEIVHRFLDNNENVKGRIVEKASKYTFCSDLVENHLDENNELVDFSAWNVVEVLSLGEFIGLYEMYYQENPSYNYSQYLKSIKFIRNIAAHNNCMLSAIKKPNGKKKFSVTKELANILNKIPEYHQVTSRDALLNNPVIHDFVTLLFVYNDVLKKTRTKDVRNRKMKALKAEFCDEDGRFQRHKDYFENNQNLTDAYKYLSFLICYIVKANDNPKHVNFL